jgi:mycobactin lysine-N-oxygenase
MSGTLSNNGSRRRVIAVLGGGPKAIAIAAKARVLRDLGLDAPDILVIDRNAIAAHWSGEHGYTDGLQILGTPPDKDIGFPYRSECWKGADGADLNPEVNRRMQAFSWQAYKIHHGSYSDWVDRGRPQPTHQAYAAYLNWAARQAVVSWKHSQVMRIRMGKTRWVLDCCEDAGGSHPEKIEADGIVITGPGPAVRTRIKGCPGDHHRVMDGRSFWQRTGEFKGHKGDLRFAVIGTGETAASVVVALQAILTNLSPITLISPHGVQYTRGESFAENRLFSRPEPEWGMLDDTDRAEFMKRTDRGVFSVNAKRALDLSEHQLGTINGYIDSMEVTDVVRLRVTYGGKVADQDEIFDYVVLAIGFESCWFIEGLLDQAVKTRIRKLAGSTEKGAIERTIDRDLAIKGLLPKLHLPMLAALDQGPGFPNLSCLGLVADRVLSTYV